MAKLRIKKLDFEIKRKLFHALIFLIIIGYCIFSREVMTEILVITLFLGIAIEALRLRFTKINNLIRRYMGSIMRPSEKNKMSGLVWTLTAIFLTSLLFENKTIILVALLYLAVGDTVAAIVGTYFGRTKLGKKTLEGSVVCFLVCFVIGVILLKRFDLALVGASVATLIEFLRLPLSDNFWIPISTGLVLSILSI